MKFLLGILVGTAVGMLFAPARGEETRRRIARELDQRGRQKAREWGAKLGEAAFDKAEKKVSGE